MAVLAYHNVVPEGEGAAADVSLHLPRAAFARQLDALVETHRVLTLREVLGLVAGDMPPGEGPWAAITFDDAYRGAMTCGLEELARRGLPATIFVAPDVLGSEGFWWDRLRTGGSTASEAGPPPRELLLTEHGGRGREILATAARESWACVEIPEHARPVTESELEAAAGRAGLTFGAHGWSHANLARLPPEERTNEVERPLAWLRERVGDAAVPAFAYPYGRSSGPTRRTVRAAGYAAAFRVSGGRMRTEPEDAHALPRINVPAGVSVDGFRLRVLGLLT